MASNVFQLFVKTPSGKNLVFQLLPTDKVEELESNILARLGDSLENYFLIYGSKVLDSERTLLSYQLKNESTVRMMYRVSAHWQRQQKEKEDEERRDQDKERRDKKDRLLKRKVLEKDGLLIGQPQYRVQLEDKEAVEIAVRQNWQALQFVNKSIIQQLKPGSIAYSAAVNQNSQPWQANQFACGPIIYYDPKNLSINGALDFICHNPMAYAFIARTKCIEHLATNIDIIEATLKSANNPTTLKNIRPPACHTNVAKAHPMKVLQQSSQLASCNLCATELDPSDRRWFGDLKTTCKSPKCQNGHEMKVTGTLEGRYSDGWNCDKCGHSIGPNEVGLLRRWCCIECTADFCFNCNPEFKSKHVCLVCHGEINSKTKVARPQLFSTLAAVQKVLSTATTYHFEAVQRQEQPAPLAPDANKLKQEKLYTR